MNENKCIGCPNYQLLQDTNWRYCKGNKCEVEIRADAIRKFAEYMNNVAHIDVSEYLYWYEKEQTND